MLEVMINGMRILVLYMLFLVEAKSEQILFRRWVKRLRMEITRCKDEKAIKTKLDVQGPAG